MGGKSKISRADTVYSKKSAPSTNPFDTAKPQTAKRVNPFDIHVNKEKFKILGRICKHDRGMPGVSRAKALQRRAQTIGKQYAVKNKTNKFMDHRIGKHLSGDQLTESVMNARYLSEKLAQVRASNKAEKFNLNDDELLTHRGQTLEEIEQYRDERSDDEELDDEVDAEFTSTAHFGGDGDTPQDRQTAIEEMISEQKRRKNEIAKDKNEVYDLTEKLDANYKLLLPLVSKATEDEQREKPPPDAYDKLLKEMVFEPRGSVTDKLIKPEELAKQEAARLEKLENERLRRMKADGEEQEKTVQVTHRSADDLDDGYFAGGIDDDADDTLAYDLDGNLGTHLNSKKQTNETPAQRSDDEDNNESEDDDEGDKEEDDSDSEIDNLSDLKESESESETEEDPKPTKSKAKSLKAKQSASMDTSIPFTIKMSKTYEDFTELLGKYTITQQAIVVERIIKCNDPKLEGVNSENVVKLFAFLLQYIKDLFEDASEQDILPHFQLVAQLMPHLYDLVQLNPERMSNTLLDVIKEKYSDYSENHKVYPSLETLIYFKLVSNLYSTSDFRHPVATPTYIFMQHILSRAQVRTRQDIAMGLFIVTIALEFGSRSKRFLPAVFNFLQGIVHMAIPKRAADQLEIVPPFDRDGLFSKLLAIPATKESKAFEPQQMQAADLVTVSLTVDFKVRALDTTLRLIKQILEELVSEHTGACFLATPFLTLLERLPLEAYPEHVAQHLAEAKAAVKLVAEQKMKPLAPPDRRPKALRLLEPRFEVVYDDKRRPKMSKQKEERAKLLQKIKREKKGAIREIRRDTAFVQELKLKQQLQSDKERNEKVKRIYQEASMQQGELNELARAKKRKKF